MTRIADPLVRRAAALGEGLDASLVLLAAIAFTTQVGVAVMLPLLPLYAVTLGADPFVLGLLTSSFAVTTAAGQLGAGYVAQRVGARPLIPAGMGLYAGANALIATANAALPLIAWRSLAGLGGGLGLISERLYLVEVVGRARLAFANGLLSAAGSAGTVAGPAVGGLVAAASDLRVPFLLVAATSAAAAVAALFLPRPGSRQAPPVPAGAPRGGSVVGGRGRPTQPERPAARWTGVEGWGRRNLAVLLAANGAMMAGFGSFITTYAPYATGELGWSTAEVAVLFSFFGLGSILGGPWLAHVADRRGRRRTAALATLPVAAFAAALVAGAPSPVLVATAVLAGAGIAGFGAAWFALLGSATGGSRGGGAFGTVSALSNLGIVLGAMVASALWAAVDIRAGVATVLVAIGAAGGSILLLPAAADQPDPEPEADRELRDPEREPA